MKISQMETDKLVEILIKIAAPVARLAEDKKISDFFRKMPKEMTIINLIAKSGEIIPVLLKDHKSDLYTILAALCEKSEDEIAKQKITETIEDIKESFDEDIVNFFMRSTTTA